MLLVAVIKLSWRRWRFKAHLRPPLQHFLLHKRLLTHQRYVAAQQQRQTKIAERLRARARNRAHLPLQAPTDNPTSQQLVARDSRTSTTLVSMHAAAALSSEHVTSGSEDGEKGNASYNTSEYERRLRGMSCIAEEPAHYESRPSQRQRDSIAKKMPKTAVANLCFPALVLSTGNHAAAGEGAQGTPRHDQRGTQEPQLREGSTLSLNVLSIDLYGCEFECGFSSTSFEVSRKLSFVPLHPFHSS